MMLRNLDIGLLRAFVAVAEQRSMTAASRILHLTQGAVSQQIARLEAVAGGALLTRGRSGVGLTFSGERLLGKARRLLALNDAICADIDGGGMQGWVSLGIPEDLLGACFAPVLKSYAAACPEVEVSVVCGSSDDLARRLADGHLDLAVLEEPVATATGECLMTDRLVWAGATGGTAWSRTPLPVSRWRTPVRSGPWSSRLWPGSIARGGRCSRTAALRLPS